MKTILISINTALFMLFFSFNMHAEEPFKCSSTFITQTVGDRGITLFKGNLVLFLINDKEGFFSLSGVISAEDKSYVLSRVSYFRFASNDINKVKQVTITSIDKHPVDNTPESNFLYDVMPAKTGVKFYVKISPLKDNLIIVKSLNSAFFICAKTD